MTLLIAWLFLCAFVSSIHSNSYYEDESSWIVVPTFDTRYPEIVLHFRFPPTESNVEEKAGAYCLHNQLSDATCLKILQEAQGRLAQWWKYENPIDQQLPKYYYEYQLGLSSHGQSYPLLKTNYCFVTAFFDLGRAEWQHGYERPAQKYINYFTKLLQTNIPLIVFVDDRYYSEVTKSINQFNYRKSYIVLIPINESFLNQHIQSWREYLATDEAIMKSSQYRAAVTHRPFPNTPETMYPRYTCLTHSKIDFVMYVLQHGIARTSYNTSASSGDTGGGGDADGKSVDFLGWIDFGYLHMDFEIIPFEMNEDMLMRPTTTTATTASASGNSDSDRRGVDYITEGESPTENERLTSTLMTGESSASDPPTATSDTGSSGGSSGQQQQQLQYRFHMMVNGELTPSDGDPLYTLMHAPERVLGCFFFAHHSALQRYASLYHRSVREMHSRGIADDEQAVMAYAYWKEPALFKVWRNLILIDEREYLGWFVAHILYNKRMRRKNAVKLFIEANRD